MAIQGIIPGSRLHEAPTYIKLAKKFPSVGLPTCSVYLGFGAFGLHVHFGFSNQPLFCACGGEEGEGGGAIAVSPSIKFRYEKRGEGEGVEKKAMRRQSRGIKGGKRREIREEKRSEEEATHCIGTGS